MQKSSATEPHHLVVARSMKCPVCNKEFFQYAVRKTRIRLVKSDIDLRNYFEPIDPLYYDIIMCNSCGYAADVIYFDKLLRYKHPFIKQEITPDFKPIILDLPYTPESAMELFEHALRCGIAKKARNSEIAYLHLKMAWIYRDMGNKEKEIEKLRVALGHFEKAYVEEDCPICTMDNLTFRYLMGAINYILGNYSEALKWLADVIVSKNAQGRLKNRAIDLKEDIRKATAKDGAN